MAGAGIAHRAGNVAAFQACWFAAVLGAAAGMPWLGPVCVAAWLSVHLAVSASAPARELALIGAAAAAGTLADAALAAAGLVSFPAATGQPGPLTTWLPALWAGFAATFGHSLAWLQTRPALAALLGALFGPLAYAGGEQLGAIELHGLPALALVGLVFATATPALAIAARRLALASADFNAMEIAR